MKINNSNIHLNNVTDKLSFGKIRGNQLKKDTFEKQASDEVVQKPHKFYVELSKDISYALRHAPEKCGIELDEQGYTSIDSLLSYLNSDKRHGGAVVKADLEAITTMFDKQRHEIKDDKIRAFYGHSFENKLMKEHSEPPKVLYHGTSPEAAESILKEGITPHGRQYVHLSANTDIAQNVGKRKDSKPVILEVDTEKASKDGVKFYLGNEDIWLADYISPKYIKVHNI